MTECRQMIDNDTLVNSIINVSKDRNTVNNLAIYDDIKKNLLNSIIFNKNFIQYRDLQYPQYDIDLKDVFKVFDEIHNLVK